MTSTGRSDDLGSAPLETSLRDRVLAATDGSVGSVVVLSENPIHDTGGGQRSAHLALELLDRRHAVVFVSRGVVTETVDLGLEISHPRLVQLSLDEALTDEGRRALVAAFRAPRAMVITQAPVGAWADVIRAAREAGAVTVYDCVDRWSSEMGRGWYKRRSERRVANESDVLVASARDLVEHVESLTERETHLIPNAFNARIFRSDTPWERPADLPEGRVALFVGALWGGWLDWDLVGAAAETLPETRFVFIGDHRREGAGLPSNCSFLGLKRQTDLPPYHAHSDVAFLPWHVVEMTHSMSPLTVYEHIAMGLPVIAPPIETLRDMPGVVTVRERADFIEALRTQGRRTVSDQTRAEIADFVADSSWLPRVDRLLEIVDQARTGPPVVRERPGAPALKTRTMLSVVIPSYNHARYIGEAVAGVRDQTLAAGELLVVDDGSTDASLDVLAEHAFPGMRCIAQQNRGAHATINRAIALSQGDYVAILNSDDTFEPERLEHAWGVAQATGAALVFGTVKLMDGGGAPLDPDHDTARWYRDALGHARRAASLTAGVARDNIAMTTSNFFLHRELWRRLGGFAPYRYVHDYDFLLRALALCPDRVVFAEDLRDVRYRVHDANTISEHLERPLAERADMLRAFRDPIRRLRGAARRPGQARAVREAVTETAPPDPVPVVTAEKGAVGGRRLRVGLVVRSLGRGGLEEVVALLARSLPAEGVDVTVLCTDAGGETADRLGRARLPVTVASHDHAAIRLWMREAAPEVLSTHFVDADVMDVLAEAGSPIVETIHNTYAWFTDDDWAREARKRDRTAALVAVSDTAARYFQDRCPGGSAPGAGSMHVIPNSVHPGRVAGVPRSFARRHFAVEDDSPLFVHHGRITGQKNVAGLLRAFSELMRGVPGARLILAGPEDPGALGRLRREVPEPFARGAVRHIPAVDAVGVLLSAADAYVSASFYEGWSVAASEALWVGRPVVLSACGGAAELVGAAGQGPSSGPRGYLVPNPVGDPLAVTWDSMERPPEDAARGSRQALVEALLSVVDGREGWTGRDEELRAWSRERLAPQRMAGEYAEVFRALAGRGSVPGRPSR